jgi:hypothetical protein
MRGNAIKLRKISPLLEKEGSGVVEKVYLLQLINYHPPSPSLVRRGGIRFNLMALGMRGDVDYLKCSINFTLVLKLFNLTIELSFASLN